MATASSGTPSSTGSSGGFHISGGQIVGPNGQVFKAQGVNVADTLLPTLVSNGQLLQNFPDLNFVRIVGIDGYSTDSSQSLIDAINTLTAKGIVVDFDNFNAPNGVATGSALTQETAWLTQMATTFKNNPYVWFGTDNEPSDASSGGSAPAGSVTAEQVADYNAIRAAGDNAPVMLEGATQATLTTSSYAGMTNVVWDDHFYNWTSGYSTDPATVAANLQQVIAPEQAITSANGTIPIIIGEFGNATDGSNIDPGGTQTVQAVLNATDTSGWAAFNYYWPADLGGIGNGGDTLVDPNTGALTSYGQQVVGAMTAARAPGSGTGGSGSSSGGQTPTPSPNGTQITSPSNAPIIDQSGNSWTLVQSASNGLQIAINGVVDQPTQNVVLLEELNGAMVQENSSGSWYSETQPNDSWVQISDPNPPAQPSSVTTGSGSDSLVLKISEDAWANGDGTSDAAGDATFTVSVDGQQLAGTFTATASHAAGQDQTFTFEGNWAPGTHTVTVNFLNDAWGGTASTDRNLYVDGVTYDGTNTNQSAALMSAGPQNFTVTDSTALPGIITGAGSDRLVIDVSEDRYLADAQFSVAVDGKQLGGTFTATTLHSSGGSQAFTFAGDFGSGTHTVSVKFLNDAYGGSPSTDRNLYVNDIIFDATDTKQSAPLYANGARSFSVSGGTKPSVSETGDHGTLQKNLSQTGTYQVGGDTFVLSSGNTSSVTLGTWTSQITYIGPSSLVLTGGAGNATVKADMGKNTFTAGTGSLDVTGGGGQDTYVFHATSGLLTIEDFSVANGDKLSIDSALKTSMVQKSDGEGGTLLTFGSGSTHAVDVHGLAAVPSSSIIWT